MKLAPIAVFAFNRPDHLLRCLESIAAADLGKDSAVIVYCDGPRTEEEKTSCEEVRKVAESFSPGLKLKVVARDENLGLKRSIEIGVTETVQEAGRVIVIEDDLELSPAVLRYFNEGLEKYEDEEKVFQLSGYQFAPSGPGGDQGTDDPMDTMFLPLTSSWGWATWQRSWGFYSGSTSELKRKRLLAKGAERASFNFGDSYDFTTLLGAALSGDVDSWAIHWYESVYREKGLTLYPDRTLIKNTGFDGSGRHCEKVESDDETRLPRPQSFRFPERAVCNKKKEKAVRDFLRSGNGSKASELREGQIKRLVGWLRKRFR